MNQNKYPILFDKSKMKFGKLNKSSDILLLFKLIFNREFKKDLIDWFSSCPIGANLWYAAFKNDEPVAMYGLLPILIKVDGVIIKGALCNNVGVIPRFQGTGLFQAMGEFSLNDSKFPLVIGVPNSKAVKGHKRIGWKSYGGLELLSGFVSGEGYEKLDINQFKYIESKKDIYFKIQKNLDFIKWRYSKPQTIYYQSIIDEYNYIIWKEYNNKKQILELSDCNLLEGFNGVVDVWAFKNSENNEKLRSKGFSPILFNEFILYTNMQLLENVNNYKFELGDNDVF
ncbi:hypothetical protein A2230_08315 [candidate division WOR-1 bacterium RIFOXYA2_FULL_36_21]|uniref:Uncharacterized protein n=1 Tax=candidate division WOR-1 bacterium RIFOXYB2_FULL_36_35 TaxID=1802578 RepID=A0A1F4S889_UNCSA|nr:MAG: hypothetical protein A2230_08315 [candidate division WOR-1 bacterium RIFOXYA2_FULL_36_21]OGC16658.1 MAG: hypothetical protein A2290_03530 [candidate division WOR-1 bacterium RIFOXYB2_FULL_36_35]